MDLNLPSSKVTVEYFDPSGVFPLLSPALNQRLPLKDLRWSSERRGEAPRSISSLLVDLVPFEEPSRTSDASRTDASNVDETKSKKQPDPPLSRNTSERTKGGRKERRHQIPGLRPTPYLKVYLLRCDDNDSYKNSKKLLKDWLKEHGELTEGATAGSESHDAYRSIILHVVLPNTGAAAQPRFSGGSTEGGSGRSSSTSRWPGRGSSTLLEKLKSDFKKDSVAQIRIPLSDMPPHLPPGSMSSSSVGNMVKESPQEQKIAWEELIDMMKTSILASFDARVTQYEDDIQEKDGQRGLPGWNFCTFFVLKEGLAIAFESVGLLEDALRKYDELDIGLEAVIREMESDEPNDSSSTSFLPYTLDLLEHLQPDAKGPEEAERGSFNEIVAAGHKAYRDLILANQVSIYDFRCYLFSRQLSLLLRLANVADPSRPQGKPDDSKTSQPEDLTVLAEICQRSVEFITSVSRNLRADLQLAYRLSRSATPPAKLPKSLKKVSPQSWPSVLEKAISAWIFSVSQDILYKTRSKHIGISSSIQLPSRIAERPLSEVDAEPKVAIKEPKTRANIDRQTNQVTSPMMFSDEHMNEVEEGGLYSRSGLQELCSRRAELYLLGRDVIAKLADYKGWLDDYPSLRSISQVSHSLQDVDLDASSTSETESWTFNLPGTSNALFSAALSSQEIFLFLYEALTEKAFWHYTSSKVDQFAESKSVERTKAERAMLRFYRGDFAFATKSFEELRINFASGGWTILEITMLDMYVECLWRMGRKEDYASKALELLSRIAGKTRANMSRGKSSFMPHVGALSNEEEKIEKKQYLAQVMKVASDIDTNVQSQLGRFFTSIRVNTYTKAHENHDGFQLQLQMTYLLRENLKADAIKVRLVDVTEGIKRHIWLETEDEVLISPGKLTVWVGSKVTMPGRYYVDTISLEAEKLTLLHDASPSNPSVSGGDENLIPRLQENVIICYAGPKSLSAELRRQPEIVPGSAKRLELVLRSGRNTILESNVRLRAGSAGLRLRLADAQIANGTAEIDTSGDTGGLVLNGIPSEHEVVINVPYSTEADLPGLYIRVSIDYKTLQGDFHYSRLLVVPMLLPLAVDVQDIFRRSNYFPKILINAANDCVLRITNFTLSGSQALAVEDPGQAALPMLIFPSNTATIIYKIEKNGNKSASPALEFNVEFRNFDEEVFFQQKESVFKYLDDSALSQYQELAWPVIHAQIRHRLAQSREQVALSGRLSHDRYHELDWTEILAAAEPERREILKKAITAWYDANRIVTLEEVNLPPHTLKLGIEVPRPPAVFHVDLHLQDISNDAYSGTRTLAVEEMVQAELRISYSSVWRGGNSPGKQSLDCNFEIVANPDHWIIGGQRQARFSALENEVKIFPLQLVPLQSGYQRLPLVYAWSTEGGSDIQQGPSYTSRKLFGHVRESLRPGALPQAQKEQSPAKSGNSTMGESVLVLPNIRSITVKVDQSGASGLLESQRREAGFIGSAS